MKAQLYHTPSFHLRERRYVRPDYARAIHTSPATDNPYGYTIKHDYIHP
ncbi:MAG: hypothetical protein K2M98_09000 [Muribaculum sp.]|nr:hypothetical protein [Muribaculum sp.]